MFHSWFWNASFEWGRPEVEALARSLNSTRITTMQLDSGSLSAGFWAALDEKLPSLTSMCLSEDVTLSAFDVAVFCSRRRHDHTLTISMNKQLYQSINGAQLQASLAGQGISRTQIDDRY
jgi:hypothetical protein